MFMTLTALILPVRDLLNVLNTTIAGHSFESQLKYSKKIEVSLFTKKNEKWLSSVFGTIAWRALVCCGRFVCLCCPFCFSFLSILLFCYNGLGISIFIILFGFFACFIACFFYFVSVRLLHLFATCQKRHSRHTRARTFFSISHNILSIPRFLDPLFQFFRLIVIIIIIIRVIVSIQFANFPVKFIFLSIIQCPLLFLFVIIFTYFLFL